MAKVKVEKETQSSALAPVAASNYLALAGASGQSVAQVIRDNVGNGGITPQDLDRVKIPTGGATIWTIPGLTEDEVVKEFDGIVIAFRDVRSYWKKAFSGDRVPPDCYSDDAEVGKGTPGGDCARCPLAEFGSKVDAQGVRGRGQACNLRKIVLVLRPQARIPYVLSVPPSSLQPFRKYLLRLASAGKRFSDVSTIFSLTKERNAGGIDYAQVSARVGRELTPAEIENVRAYQEAIMPVFQKVTIDVDEVVEEH